MKLIEKLLRILGASSTQAKEVELPGERSEAESLGELLTPSGRISFDVLLQLERGGTPEAFEAFVREPVLAGSSVEAGTVLSQNDQDARRRKKTLLFRPAALVNEVRADSDPLQRAIYPLVKGRSSKSPEAYVFMIGRGTDNDLAMSDFAISEKHARIEKIENAYWISDLLSTNGTKVNAQNVGAAPVRLKDGDVIALARYDFTFLYPHSLYKLLKARD